MLGQYEAAIADYSMAITKDAKYAQAYAARAAAYRKVRNPAAPKKTSGNTVSCPRMNNNPLRRWFLLKLRKAGRSRFALPR